MSSNQFGRAAILFAAVFFLLCEIAKAGPFEDGVNAFQRNDYATALRLWRPLANQGKAEAQFNIGLMYDGGLGVKEDRREAANWYRLAANQGYAAAQYNLGVMYGRGAGVNQDSGESIKWFRMAASRGYADAEFILGMRYKSGVHVAQDNVEAVKWFLLAAEHGHAAAQFMIGVIYEKGEGVPRNESESLKWHRLAALQGNSTSQMTLGSAYEDGTGVAQDYSEAVKWHRLAALQGNDVSQHSLGVSYFKGRGVIQDYVESHKWFNLAGVSGDKDAADARRVVESKLTREQIAQAQAMAKTCLTSKYKDCGDSENVQNPANTSPPTNTSQGGSESKRRSAIAIPLKMQGGTFVVPVLVNDAITLNFVVDSGAADVSIPADVVSTLMRTGTLKQSDFLGKKTYVLADGSKLPSQTFRIRSMKVGDRVIEKLTGSVAPLQGSLLLGQSFLSRFKSWSIDNKQHVLLLE
ncbi:hypothetical protein D4R49_01485 [bacterium]|nr:MAG: hypothetical protein D4R49_01485 [bacterium]